MHPENIISVFPDILEVTTFVGAADVNPTRSVMSSRRTMVCLLYSPNEKCLFFHTIATAHSFFYKLITFNCGLYSKVIFMCKGAIQYYF